MELLSHALAAVIISALVLSSTRSLVPASICAASSDFDPPIARPVLRWSRLIADICGANSSMHVLDAIDQSRAFLQKTIAAARLAGQGAARNREDLPILLQRHPGGDQRAAFSAASTITTPRHSPEIRRLRVGKFSGDRLASQPEVR